MFLEVMLFTLAGIGAGVLVGLVPGIHPNTVFAMLLPAIFTAGASGSYPLMAFVVAISVSNTIVNFIPSIFIGAPEEETSLSVLPGHRMLLRGEGYSALFMTVVGSALGAILTAAALPLMYFTIPLLYAGMESYTHMLLLFVFLLLLAMERGWGRRACAAFMFLSSGLAGVTLLYSMPSEAVLFPALSGLFGIPLLLMGARGRTAIPKQKMKKAASVRPARGSVTGWIAGLLVGLLPGIGSAQAGVLSGTALRGRRKDFMVSLGAIATANIMFTFIALAVIGKARSGAAAAIEELGISLGAADVAFMMAVSLFSCFLACLFTLWTGRRAAGALSGVDYGKVNVLVLAAIVVLIAVLSGPAGVAIAALLTVMGISCEILGVKRMYLMGFLMLPTMLFFAGLLPDFLIFVAP
ncbi:MAG: tripartite tricarboxylate transporter permease [Candidatus Aenigmatarchaeota archaeon]